MEGGLNTYAYVGGNPLSLDNPRGLAPRKLNPDSQECRKLQEKIKQRSDRIAKRAKEMYVDIQKLPVNPSMPGLPDKMSKEGHAKIIDEQIEYQKRDIDLYNQKCGCDDDCPGGAGSGQKSSNLINAATTVTGVACIAVCVAFIEICIPGLLIGGMATR